MNILEQEIEDVIYKAIQDYDFELLQTRGLPIYPTYTYRRQFQLGKYGRADLIGYRAYKSIGKQKRRVEFQVFELKKDEINFGTFRQALKYAMGVRHLSFLNNINYDLSFQLILIGKRVETNGEFFYLSTVFPNIRLFTYEISLKEGITFNEHINHTNIPEASFPSELNLMELLKENVVDNTNVIRERLAIDRYFQVEANKKDLELAKDLPF
jgi:hypothetical protein